jgi:tetratricopeptide (TPR) repeat protein
MAIDRDMLIALRADPTPERFMVVADYLQTQGDPRGELIALDAHARATGTKRDPRADEIESRLRHELFHPPFGSGTMWMTWELGFLRELTIPSGYIPEIRKRGWFEADDLVLLRSLSIADQHGTVEDAQPIELLVASPLQFSLEHLAIGSSRGPLVDPDRLLALFAAIGPLKRIELQANVELDHDRLRALEQIDRLEALTLWAPGDHALLERLLATRWPHLKALSVTASGPQNRSLPAMMRPLLDGVQHPALTELALFGCGFEDDLIRALAGHPKRLSRLGLPWRSVTIDVLKEVEDELAGVELTWPRPPGVPLSADDEYQFSRRLRAGLGRKREALPHAKRACLVGSRVYFHWTEAGYGHDGVDEIPEALAAMERAVALDPARWGGWAGCGDALRKLGRYADAHEMYRRGLARDDSWVSLHYGRGETFECEGRIDEAIESYEQAVEHSTTDANDAWYLGAIAHTLINHRRAAEARDRIARALELDPDSTRLARIDGYARLAVGLPEEAMSIGNRLDGHGEDDDRLFIHALRAAAYRALDLPEQAKQLYRQIADDTDCPAWIAFGWLGLAALGEDPLAPLSAIHDPHALADAIAAHVNRTRATKVVHDTTDRCNDRINCALAAIGCAAAVGRLDEARDRIAALADYLRGPSPVKYVDCWLEQTELLRAIGTRRDAALLDSAITIACGGAMLIQ